MMRKQTQFLALLVGLVIALSSAVALARAGGGQGYSGGSHHSSPGMHGPAGGWNGESGGGGGEGIPLDMLIRLLFWYPQLSIPLLVVVVLFIYWAQRQAIDGHQVRTIRRANLMSDETRRAQALALIKERDAAFDEAAFLGRAETAFGKIQAAWCGQDLSAVRQFISDGIAERFNLQFREQKLLGYRNQLDNLQVLRRLLEQAVPGQVFDAVTVSIAASARDYNVSLADGRRLPWPDVPSQFVEYWSFLRRAGAATKDGAGLVEGCCPNCGAAIEMNQWSQCASCGSLLRSGEFDWVLAEITQECEWNPHDPSEPAGVAAFQAADPGFNRQHLEDRASVVFWRGAMAQLLGTVDPLRKVAADSFCETFRQELKAVSSNGAPATRTFWGNCAVGSVDLRAILPGEPLDRALVEIRWSGRTMLHAADGSYQQQHGVGEFRTLFVLGRKTGLKTSVDASLASTNCPSCGAPESDEASNACEFCGTVLNDGSVDWVLFEGLPIDSAEAHQYLDAAQQASFAEWPAASGGETQPPGGPPAGAVPAAMPEPIAGAPEGAALLAWLVKMVYADNELSPRERLVLERFAARQGVPLPRLNAMIDAAVHQALELPEPSGPQQARVWLAAMADMSLADGKVTPEEFALLSDAGARMGFDRGQVKDLLKERRDRLYRQARDQLRRPDAEQ